MTYLMQIEPGGFCEFSVQPTNSMHHHPHWEICFVTRGKGEYLEGGEVYRLERGSVFSSPPHLPHEIRSLETRDLEVYFVSFSLKPAPAKYGAETDLVIDRFLGSRSVVGVGSEAIWSMVELFRSGVHEVVFQFVVQSFAFQAMNDLTRDVNSESDTTRSNLIHPSLFVKRALGFIREHAQQLIQVEDVAAFVGTSSKTLQRHFQAQLGRSVGKEIRSVKYRNCAHQLLMGYSVQQVAEYSGVHDPSQFSNAFKREIGESPKQFQQKYLQMSR